MGVGGEKCWVVLAGWKSVLLRLEGREEMVSNW